MNIFPDPVISAIQLLPFLVTFAVLWSVLFRPLQAYLAERDEVVEKARHDADHFEKEARAAIQRVEESLATARKDAADIRSEARLRAGASEAEILKEARGKADKFVGDGLVQIQADTREAGQALRGAVQTLSRDIAGQVLGRSIEA